MSELVTRERVGGTISRHQLTKTDALLPLLPIVSGTSNSEVATNYNMFSRITVIAMLTPENTQLPKTLFLRARCDGKTLAQIEPIPRKGGKEMIAVPAELMDKLSKDRFFVDAAFGVEKAAYSLGV